MIRHPAQQLRASPSSVPIPDVQMAHLLMGVAEHAREGWVEFLQLAVQVDDGDAVIGLLEEHPPPDDFFRQGGFGQLPFGYVHDESVPERAAIGLSHRHGAQLYPRLTLSRVPHAVFLVHGR